MVRNTWEAVLDLVRSILGLGHDVVDIVYAMVEDVENLGDNIGKMVSGKGEDHEYDVELDDDIAELLDSIHGEDGDGETVKKKKKK